MFVADNWKDYEVIDTSCGEKLERWGDYILVRPDPQVIWDTPKNDNRWKHMNGHYHRSSKGGGEWEFFDLPQSWTIKYESPSVDVPLTFNLKPFSFKHTGIFPEQAANWDWFSEIIKKAKDNEPDRQIKVLNLFAYTGGATLACAAAGAHVTHVDASKGIIAWAKENATSSGLIDKPIRWIVDDCVKFVEREIRRGNHYDVHQAHPSPSAQAVGEGVLVVHIHVQHGDNSQHRLAGKPLQLPQAGAEEQVLLQGVVDCCFETLEGITVVDFKTDRVDRRSVAARAEEYRPQLAAYSRALEEITGKPVIRRCLWFFALDQAVDV